MGEHAPISPSALHCHLKCFGRYQLCKDLPPSGTSEYAYVGTIKHDISALILSEEVRRSVELFRSHKAVIVKDRGGEEQVDYFNQEVNPYGKANILFEYQLTDDDLQEVQIYLDEIEKIKALCSKHAIFLIEQKRKMDWLSPLCYGTADFVAIEPMEFMYVVDAKFGQKAVDAIDNPQLMAYGLAMLGEKNEHMVEEVILKIIQPKCFSSDNEFICALSDLYEWGRYTLKPAIDEITGPNPELTSGPHCDLWCPGKESNVCPEFQKQELIVAEQMFTDGGVVAGNFEPVKPQFLTGIELQKALDIAAMASIWLKAVQKEGLARAMSNHPQKAPNYKLVKGRMGDRKFKEVAVVEDALSPVLAVNQLYEKKLYGVPAIEKMLKSVGAVELLDSVLLPRREGKLKLVHRNAKGKEVVPVEEMFKEG